MSDEMMKPCPFCGGAPATDENVRGSIIYCDNDKCPTSVEAYSVASWNTSAAASAEPVELPQPVCTYADHSYPAFTKQQMLDYGAACRRSSSPAPDAEIVAAKNAEIDALVTVLQATQGRIMNAKIDLGSGYTKAQVARMLLGIIEFVDGALASRKMP